MHNLYILLDLVLTMNLANTTTVDEIDEFLLRCNVVKLLSCNMQSDGNGLEVNGRKEGKSTGCHNARASMPLIVIICMEGGDCVDDKADEDKEEEEEGEILAVLMLLAHKNCLHQNDVPYGHKTTIMLRLPLRFARSGASSKAMMDKMLLVANDGEAVRLLLTLSCDLCSGGACK
ncbi:unnamed protein product [Hydatigera taeniaeformis]|uniref:Secreted protein n=1 Tax=Hydatigena taeniaeformis TaxID=6205 RepID=A0A0R3XDM3_HYDTA|nr:unnamed protein product [Hydatigera taeniaeformis]